MIDIAVIGLGKMGISHLAIANALPDFRVVAACDATSLVANGLAKISGLPAFTDHREVLNLPGLQAVIIATPTKFHEQIVRECLVQGLHTFCEKPLVLRAEAGRELDALAHDHNLVTQVGYHNRFVATFAEMKTIIQSGALGKISHVQAEAYGPVVTRPAKATWRGKASEGGGALLDYAAHPLNLVNWYLGTPDRCESASLKSIFSADVEDEVQAALSFADGVTAGLSVNWSDSSHRKMTTQISIWGERGKLYADRQELRAFFTAAPSAMPGYEKGWNVRYTTELTKDVQFYLRGEEYSAQLEGFAESIRQGSSGTNDFRSAVETDETLSMIRNAANGVTAAGPAPTKKSAGLLSKMFGQA